MTIQAHRTLKPASRDAIRLLTEGSVAFSRIEQAGIRIDTRYLDHAIKSTARTIEELEKAMWSAPEFKLWQRHFGNDMKIDGRAQLGHVIFDLLKHPRNPHMVDKNGKAKNDVHAFEHLDLPFISSYFGVQRLKKALDTVLIGIKKETVGEYIHPFFDLHTVESYRSSSSKPNFHNMHVRDKAVAEIVRKCVVPRPGCVLLEADYSAQEVRVNACYNHDPKLIESIVGGMDMHRDRALDIYLLTPKELGPTSGKVPGKDVRYVAKNRFVFPQFYGSVYTQCAPALWEAISMFNLKRADGVSLREHLQQKGVTELGACSFDEEPREGTFEKVVAEVERHMWQDVFTVYDQWKRDWWDLYQRQGGVNTLTGFCLAGVFRRNQVLANPPQGSAFHCELWSVIQIQQDLLRRKMKSRIINQIHDSMLLDVPYSELDDVVEMIERWAVREIRKHWPWIIVDLQVEFELCPENWAGKSPMEVKK